MNGSYHDYLVKRFHEETQGEVMFRTLAEQASDTGRVHKWRVLQQLEKETKELLAAELSALGFPIAEDPAEVEEGISKGHRFSSLPWLDFMAILRSAIENFVSIFEGAELDADEGWNPHLLSQITRHERALLAFIVCEIEGRGDRSLDDVLALLEEWQTLRSTARYS